MTVDECERSAYEALTYIVYGRTVPVGGGIERFARSCGQISNAYISETVKDNPINMDAKLKRQGSTFD